MKGLIYRDFCLVKKNWIPVFCISVGAVIWNILVQLSFEYGNFKKYLLDDPNDTSGAGEVSRVMIYYIGLYMIPYLALILMDTLSVVRADLPVKWATNRKIFPVTALQWTVSIYSIKVIGLLIAIILFLINGSIMAHMTGNIFGIYEFNNMLLFACFYLAFDWVQMAFMVRVRTEKEMNSAAASPLLVLIPMFALAYPKCKSYAFKLETLFPEDAEIEVQERISQTKGLLQSEFGVYRDAVAPYLWLIVLALFALGFYLTYLGIKRREK